MRNPHDIRDGYSTRTIEVRAYGHPVPAPVMYFHAGKMMGRARGGYPEWVASMQEQFKLARADFKIIPNHRLEWRSLEIVIMVATKHRKKWGCPRHESRTPALWYAQPVIQALEVAALWDRTQKANDVRVRRVYAPASGVMVKIGVTQERVEFEV